MPVIARNCPHIANHGDLSILDLLVDESERFAKCSDCDNEGPNLWLCLFPDCKWVGCSSAHSEHSTIHNKEFPSHCAHMNLSTERIWCYLCKHEVMFMNVPSPPMSPILNDVKSNANKYSGDAPTTVVPRTDYWESAQATTSTGNKYSRGGSNRIDWEKGALAHEKSRDSPDSTDSDDSKDLAVKPKGLVGLQNIGNTCYMNAALQALSNVPPLTQFFLECGPMVNCILKDRKPGLSLSYLHHISEMWNKKTRGYVVPHSILYWIRTVHPMFRGYHQHDTQEFLRCFMDQLHEELKEQIEDDCDSKSRLKGFGDHSSDEDDADIDGNGSSQSDAEYETCDSGVSEQSSLSDEGERGTKRRYYRLPQSDKTRNKFTNRNSKKSTSDDVFSQQQRPQPNSPTKPRTKKPMKTRSIISDIFDGKLLSNVQCLTCDRVSNRVETFQDLSLPIPSRDHIDMLHQGSLTPQKAGPCSDVVYVTNQSGWVSWFWHWMRSWFWGPVVSLHDCLSAFFSADELKGDNMYSCEKCNKLRNGIKFSKVLELPEVLCVHLKRFRHELMFSSKIANYVSFPLNGLDMRPYLHKECVSKVTTYDLISVICHHGTAGGGHYTCYALNSVINQWFEFDDQCVTEVSPETVKNCEAYVLFYKKCSPEMTQIQEKTVELMEISAMELSHFHFFVSRQWINRFNTFSEPGPIDNSDFLCPHGGVNPARAQFVDKISIPVPQDVWEYLYDKFGGGPPCTQLYECPFCEEKHESLQKRTRHEMEMFQRLHHNVDSCTPTIYALSMDWLRQWQSFVRGKEMQPPGPIDNTTIIINKNGQNALKPGSDYAQISEELWQFFLNIYGGGPEFRLHSCQRSTALQPNNSLHSTSNPNLIDPSSKPNRQDVKMNKITTTRSTETITQQGSVLDCLMPEVDSHEMQGDASS